MGPPPARNADRSNRIRPPLPLASDARPQRTASPPIDRRSGWPALRVLVAEAASDAFHCRQQRSLGAERDARQEELCLAGSRGCQPKRIAAPFAVHVASSIESKAALDEPFVVERRA